MRVLSYMGAEKIKVLLDVKMLKWEMLDVFMTTLFFGMLNEDKKLFL